jgi:predicted TIM-barrel fold metal-dependent hydrolase
MLGVFLSLLATSRTTRTVVMSTAAAPVRIDSHLHIWSDGEEPYPWAVPPPDELKDAATAENLVASARKAGVSGALIVQPANHKFDHSYVTAALKAHPDFFRGMLLANPTVPVDDAVAELEALHAAGYAGARFNPGLFGDVGGLAGEVGRALYKRCGELSMPVGVMAFGGLLPQLEAIKELAAYSPATTLIIDHMGFFRQPATGGLLGDGAKNDEEAWKALLSLASIPRCHVKVSALFRTSAELPPHLDLQPRLKELIAAFGTERLMWGSDFPFVLIGGNTPTEAGTSYAQAAEALGYWTVPELEGKAFDAIMGGNAKRLFGF